MKWKPFSTVPMDGTMVDLYHESDGRYPDCYYEDEVWESYYYYPDQLPSIGGFTHWMECPENPPEDIKK